MTYPKEYGGLGFRNLHLFNMAMVAKHGWNFMTKPDTLVTRIYKA
ncbi:RNA-directed DNA polymerase (Reverse transcriptase), partial [Trifolium medium]|nr:RNA-directed DNA polymerase (Reverse transcriptase) [Trifolium medium]